MMFEYWIKVHSRNDSQIFKTMRKQIVWEKSTKRKQWNSIFVKTCGHLDFRNDDNDDIMDYTTPTQDGVFKRNVVKMKEREESKISKKLLKEFLQK